jgi:hypothetical protein
MTRPMTPETAAALEASIAHWEANAVAETPEKVKIGILSCALCRLFLDEGCIGCPVRAKTGVTRCNKTPYVAAHAALRCWTVWRGDKTRDDFHAAARAEVEFLKGLRAGDATIFKIKPHISTALDLAHIEAKTVYCDVPLPWLEQGDEQ